MLLPAFSLSHAHKYTHALSLLTFILSLSLSLSLFLFYQVLVHPTCGPTQPDDIPGIVR
jgi:uncharacterized protein with PQ loop repeat